MNHGQSLAIGIDLNSLVTATKFNYLEIGCYDGWNIGSLGRIFPNKRIFGIDPFISDGHVPGQICSALSQQKINLYKNIEGLSNVSFYELTSEQFFKEHQSSFQDMNISCVFVDGAHIYDIVKLDSDLALKCIMSNQTTSGEIVFHDLHIPDVVKAIDYFKEKCKRLNAKIAQFAPGHFKVEL